MDKPVNTTAFSLLGLLGKRDWSAPELARFMERSVIRYILPRTRSQLYSEPKRLVKLGLARARQEPGPGRRRTVYSITAKGRRALARWLAEPGEALRLEHKTLLKFYLTDYRDTAALRSRLAEMREETLASVKEALAQVSRITTEGIALEQTAVAASLVSGMAASQYRAQLAWLDTLEQALEELPGEPDAMAWAMARYERSRDELEQLLRGQGSSSGSSGDGTGSADSSVQ